MAIEGEPHEPREELAAEDGPVVVVVVVVLLVAGDWGGIGVDGAVQDDDAVELELEVRVDRGRIPLVHAREESAVESTAARQVRRRAEDVERTEGGPMGDAFAFASGTETRGCGAASSRVAPAPSALERRAIDDVIAARASHELDRAPRELRTCGPRWCRNE